MQEDFAALCKDYKKQTNWYQKRLAALEKNLDAQKEISEKSETHAIFLEDQARFHREQCIMVSNHLQTQSKVKDDAMALLENKLSEVSNNASSSSRSPKQMSAAEIQCEQVACSKTQ